MHSLPADGASIAIAATYFSVCVATGKVKYMRYTMCKIIYFSLQGRPLKVSPQQPANSTPVPPPPKPKSTSTEAARQENEEILNAILPPRYSSSYLQYIVRQVQTTLSFISTSAITGNGWRETNCGCSRCPVRLVQEQMLFT